MWWKVRQKCFPKTKASWEKKLFSFYNLVSSAMFDTYIVMFVSLCHFFQSSLYLPNHRREFRRENLMWLSRSTASLPYCLYWPLSQSAKKQVKDGGVSSPQGRQQITVRLHTWFKPLWCLLRDNVGSELSNHAFFLDIYHPPPFFPICLFFQYSQKPQILLLCLS